MPDFTRLNRVVKRAVSISKATTFRIRKAALHAATQNKAFVFGNILPRIYREASRSLADAYTAGFRSVVGRRKYDIRVPEYLEEELVHELDSFLDVITTSIQSKVMVYQTQDLSKTKIAQLFRKDFENLGLAGNSFRLEAIFNTALTAAFNAGIWDANKLPENETKVWGYRYQTAKDDRVRPNHAKLQGFTRPKDDPLWNIYAPPNGYNCRCYLQTLVKPAKPTRKPRTMPDEGFEFKQFVGN